MSILFHIFHSETKVESQSLGAVDDFCPVCREVRRFENTNYYSMKRNRLLLLIPLSSEKVSSDYAVCACPDCGSRWESEGARGLGNRRGHRLQLEEKVKARTTSPEERSDLLLEPFLKMASMSRVHQFLGNRDPASRWGCYGTLGFLLVVPTLAVFLAPVNAGDSFIAAIATITGLSFAGGTIATLVAFATWRRRYVRRELESRIARSLKPLGPSKHELTAAVEEFRRIDPKLGRHFDGPRLHDRIRGVVR